VPFQLNEAMHYAFVLHRIGPPSGLRELVPKSWNGTSRTGAIVRNHMPTRQDSAHHEQNPRDCSY
jgi:hypothetical protein